MRYVLKPLHCRPWLLNGLSAKLIESHYENNYGGALRRLNAITAQLEAADFASLPGFNLNGLKREELVALNSVILHELYFASLGGDGRVPGAFGGVLARDFGSLERWKAEFAAMGRSLGGGSGWVLLTWVPRERRLMNQFAADHSQNVAGGVPILAMDMYEHSYHIAGVRRRAGHRPGGSEGDARRRAEGAVHRCAAEALRLAHAGDHRRRDLARPRARAGLGRRALEERPGGRVLRVRGRWADRSS
jgi:superoxide dismutase